MCEHTKLLVYRTSPIEQISNTAFVLALSLCYQKETILCLKNLQLLSMTQGFAAITTNNRNIDNNSKIQHQPIRKSCNLKLHLFSIKCSFKYKCTTDCYIRTKANCRIALYILYIHYIIHTLYITLQVLYASHYKYSMHHILGAFVVASGY
jgi:hypothetical protein